MKGRELGLTQTRTVKRRCAVDGLTDVRLAVGGAAHHAALHTQTLTWFDGRREGCGGVVTLSCWSGMAKICGLVWILFLGTSPLVKTFVSLDQASELSWHSAFLGLRLRAE